MNFKLTILLVAFLFSAGDNGEADDALNTASTLPPEMAGEMSSNASEEPMAPAKNNSSSDTDPCAKAPTKALRIVCEQLHRWDKSAREMPPLLGAVLPTQPGMTFAVATVEPVATTLYECLDLGCVCKYMNGKSQEGSNSCQLSDGQSLKKAVRKEYRMLSDEERRKFHATMNGIKKNGEYDKIAELHAAVSQSGAAHAGPAFLPWHREFLKRMEIALRQVDPLVAIPYWDSSLEAQLPTPADSYMFTKDFMGDTDAKGNLVVGDFAGWRTLDPNVIRHVGQGGKCFSEDEFNAKYALGNFRIQWFLNQRQIDKVLGYSFPQPGCKLELDYQLMEVTHSNVHLFVGGEDADPPGHMTDTNTSANDPLFYLHHAFVDCIWEQWRLAKQSYKDREITYPTDNDQCATAMHFGTAPMRPFQPWRNMDGLSNKYTDHIFEYAPRPNCQMGPDCGSKYLFCDRSHGKPHCAAKVRPRGNCKGFHNGEKVCYNGICRGGRCTEEKTELPKIQPHPPTTLQPPKKSSPKPSTTQPSPPTTIQTPKQSSPAACFNKHECCAIWAEEGECKLNQGFMQTWCKASCRQCQFDYDINEECADRHPNCRKWANNDKCQRNKFWMIENCRQACGKCQMTRRQVCNGGSQFRQNQHRLTETPSALQSLQCTSQGCYNGNRCCQLWSLAGECGRNAIWMNCFCKVSCGKCIPQDYVLGSSCTDHHIQCGQWANAGKCWHNPWMLENCKQSCGTCLSQDELRQRCRLGGRGKRDAIGMMPSTFEFPLGEHSNEAPGVHGPPEKGAAGAEEIVSGQKMMPESDGVLT